MLKLTMNGGIGLNSDTNAFFRNWEAFNASSPIAPGPPTGLNVTFTDVSIEPGIGGITRLGQQPVYVYGAATVVASGTLGPDIYQRNDSMHVAIEKGYGGVLWARDKRTLVNASVGQTEPPASTSAPTPTPAGSPTTLPPPSPPTGRRPARTGHMGRHPPGARRPRPASTGLPTAHRRG